MMSVAETHSAASRLHAPPPRRTWRQALRYFSRFGLKTGWQATRLRARTAHPVMVRLPELLHPLWVRPGTSDAATFDEVFVSREYDLPLADFSPRRILDLGANVGFVSVLFASRWPNASILSVEPQTENILLLKRNAGHYRGITALHAAVWSRATDVVIENPADAANAFRVAESNAAEAPRVPALTIPQLIERLGGERVDLLKMDVEGAEREILRDARSWLDRVAVLMIELHDRIVPGCAEALYQALQGRRLRQEIVGQNLVIDLRPTP